MEYILKVSRNSLLDRLRVLQSELTEENRHSDAMTIDFVIQIMSVDAYAEKVGRQDAVLPGVLQIISSDCSARNAG
jgi:hypothetical protein